MVAWVTSGLAVPGVHAASGRTPPGTARGWHSAPELVTGGGTGAAVAVRPAAAVRVGEGATGSELDGSSGGAADEGRDSADAVTGGCDGGLGGAAAGVGVEQAARGSSSSTAARFTGSRQRDARRRPGGPGRRSLRAELVAPHVATTRRHYTTADGQTRIY